MGGDELDWDVGDSEAAQNRSDGLLRPGESLALEDSLHVKNLLLPHDRWMRVAIQAASYRAKHGGQPFGCLIVTPRGERLALASGTGTSFDPLAHSEMLAIRNACRVIGPLQGCTLYSTHEPCPMCAGAITYAKLSRVVFGSYRGDLADLFQPKPVAAEVLRCTTHPPEVIGGVLRSECIALFRGRGEPGGGG